MGRAGLGEPDGGGSRGPLCPATIPSWSGCAGKDAVTCWATSAASLAGVAGYHGVEDAGHGAARKAYTAFEKVQVNLWRAHRRARGNGLCSALISASGIIRAPYNPRLHADIKVKTHQQSAQPS